MSNNKARKYTSPILEELMSEITPEEMKATEQKMLQELNKQSSIEWLAKNIPDLGKYIPFGVSMELHAKFQQAKEMHKQEIMNACDRFANSIDFTIEDFEQYYNETFGE